MRSRVTVARWTVSAQLGHLDPVLHDRQVGVGLALAVLLPAHLHNGGQLSFQRSRAGRGAKF